MTDSSLADIVEMSEPDVTLRPVPVEPARSSTARLPPARWRLSWPAVGAATAAALALLVWRNRQVFSRAMYEAGDLAADSRQVEIARNLQLVHGQYSRFGFYHPGPVYFYVRAAGEWLLRDHLHLVPARFNGQYLGILAVDALTIGLVAALLARRTRRPVMLAVLAALVLLAGTLQPAGSASHPWMPMVLIWPFALLLVASAELGSGEIAALPFAVLGGALCVSGSVNTAPFVALVLVMGGVLGHVRRSSTTAVDGALRRSLAWTAVVVVPFAVPLLFDIVHGSDSNVAAIWRYLRTGSTYRNGLRASVGYAARSWVGQTGYRAGPLAVSGGIVVAGIAAWLLVPAGRRRRALGTLAVLVLAASTLGVFYARRYIDDLHLTYVQVFQVAGPVVLFAALIVAVVDVVLGRGRPTWLAPTGLVSVMVALALLLSLHHGLTAPGLYTTGVDQVESELTTRYPAGAFALDFDLSQTPLGLSLFVLMHRDGHDICFANPDFAVTHTMPPEDLCEPGSDQPRVTVTLSSLDDAGASDAAIGQITGPTGTVVVTATSFG